MMKFYQFLVLSTMLLLAAYIPGFTRGGHHGGDPGYCNPDSLIPVTVSGTAIIDSSMMHPMYYLDEDGDGDADYHLNFGPPWYEPDSSGATRPQNGDPVTIDGGLHESQMGNLPVIVVYEINGLFWRDPYDPFWTHGGHGGGHHHGGQHGHTGGWMHDSLEVVTVNGTALVDTTFVFEHYYLDEDSDGMPDYFLNFGPPWYQPPSGAVRPNDGDPVGIVGGLIENATLPMVIVFEINGLVWRDTTGFGHHIGGSWIHHNMTQAQHINTPFDPEDWMHVNPGWHQGGGHHGGMPQSLFCQMIELFPANAPNTGNENVFAAYEIGLFDGNNTNILWHQGGMGGHVGFANNVNYQFHYNDIQLQGFNIDENTITAKYWNEQSNSWVEMNSAVVDPVNNTVTVSNSNVSSSVILTGTENPLSIDQGNTLLPAEFTLDQNYPNPFNPETTIEFTLQQNAQVVLSIYNVLGQKLFEVLNGPKAAGVHQVNIDGRSLTSGIYFYELKVGQQSQVKKMTLNK